MKRIRKLMVAVGAALALGACSSATGPSNLNSWDPATDELRQTEPDCATGTCTSPGQS